MKLPEKYNNWLIKHNLKKGTFIEEPFIYVDWKNNPTKEMTNTVKWLKKVTVYCFKSQKDALAISITIERYPELKDYIWLF